MDYELAESNGIVIDILVPLAVVLSERHLYVVQLLGGTLQQGLTTEEFQVF